MFILSRVLPYTTYFHQLTLLQFYSKQCGTDNKTRAQDFVFPVAERQPFLRETGDREITT